MDRKGSGVCVLRGQTFPPDVEGIDFAPDRSQLDSRRRVPGHEHFRKGRGSGCGLLHVHYSAGCYSGYHSGLSYPSWSAWYYRGRYH